MTPLQERIEIVQKELGLTNDFEFAKLCGMSRAMISQLKLGLVKSFSPRYAYDLEDNTGFCARWMIFGEGPIKTDLQVIKAAKIMYSMNELRRGDVLKIITALATPDDTTSHSI